MWHALLDVVLLLTGALLLGVLLERLRQSALIGYMLAGILLGPGVLNVVRDRTVIEGLAELGVALLLFTIGLDFSWRRLRSLGPLAIGGGTLQIFLTGGIIAGIAVLLGASPVQAIAFGIIAAPSSTACVLRVLGQRAEVESVHGRAALGILLLQDVAVIPLVLILTTLSGQHSAEKGILQSLMDLASGGVWVLTFVVISNYFLPKLFDATALARNRELPILLAITTFLAATWGAHAINLSPVLGAFVAGVLLAESPYATWIRADVGSLRTLFATLFFASVTMIDDLGWLRSHWHWLAVAVPAILLFKAAVIVVVGYLFRLSLRHAIATGICLAQMGEFSFVLVKVAEGSELLGQDAVRLIVTSTVGTLLITPYLVSLAPAIGARLSHGKPRIYRQEERRDHPKEDRSGESSDTPHSLLQNHVIVVGLGPAGEGVLNALKSEGITPAVLDMNPKNVRAAGARGIHAEVGDATQEESLEDLYISLARAVVITIPDQRTALEVAGQARLLAPHVPIFARARYHVHAHQWQDRNIYYVDEEADTGHRLGMKVIEALKLEQPVATLSEPTYIAWNKQFM